VVHKVVSFEEADKKELYTLSARGVTQHREGAVAQIASLDQWEREVTLFQALRRLAVFRHFWEWKGFR
jgi:dynein heavy chain, axonemal